VEDKMGKITLNYTFAIKQLPQESEKVAPKVFKQFIPKVIKAIQELANLKDQNIIGFTELPNDKKIKKDVEETFNKIKDWADTLVIIGIGGSSLGNKCLHMALNDYCGFYKSKNSSPNKKVFILDNLCSSDIHNLLNQIDLKSTVFNVISKSGSTLESISNFLIFYDLVKQKCNKPVSKHFIFTTTVGKGDLYKLAKNEGMLTLNIPNNVGGRYSVLSAVGLLSALFADLDINAILEGAKLAYSYCWDNSIENNPAATAALLYYLFIAKIKKNSHVFWAYSSKLDGLCQWFSQLWAESLGKCIMYRKRKIHIGQSPIPTIGPRDQHSLWQLYLDGPADKIYTLIKTKTYPYDVVISNDLPNLESFSLLKNYSINYIVSKEQQAIEFVLAQNGRPFICFELDKIDEYHMGQLLYLLEFITSLTGLMLKIDPFNQPAVEKGKIITYALLNHPHYQSNLQEMKKFLSQYKIMKTK
jgi:glucose-6-phosphate isomerase